MDLQWLPPEARHGKSILLEGDEARHIVQVRRHKPGDEILFTDGEGNFLHARIDRVDARALHAEVTRVEQDPRETDRPLLILALALLKNDHFELALEKCVELGVHRVIPLLAEHCVVRWKQDAAERKLERWRRIAISAMKQSGRTRLPEVLPPSAPSALAELVPEDCAWVVGDETEDRERVEELPLGPDGPRMAVVGPEGGFSPRERAEFEERGARAVTLSPFRLRAETAAVVLVASLAALGSARS